MLQRLNPVMGTPKLQKQQRPLPQIRGQQAELPSESSHKACCQSKLLQPELLHTQLLPNRPTANLSRLYH